MKVILVACTCFFFFSCSSITKIYLVRHAEKASNTANPDLKNPEGFARANALRDRLSATVVNGIFSTNYFRTVHTAGPTALATKQHIYIYTDGNKLTDSLSQKKNKKYLVIGHSNTIPEIIRHVGLDPGFSGDIADNDFDDLFIITIKRKGSKLQKTIRKETYGAPSP